MKKPKLFIAAIALLVLAGLVTLTALILVGQAENTVPVWELFGLAVVLYIACAGLVLVRQENQNQRVNTRGNEILKRILIRKQDEEPDSEFGNAVSLNIAQLRRVIAELEAKVPDLVQPANQSASGVTRSAMERTSGALSHKPVEKTELRPSVAVGADSRVVATPAVKRGTQSIWSTEETCRTDRIKVDHELSDHTTLTLTKEPLKFEVELENARRVSVSTTVVTNTDNHEYRRALMFVNCRDHQGRKLDFKLLPSYSDKYGYFAYLPSKGSRTTNQISIDVPRTARALEIGVVSWSGYSELANLVEVDVMEENPAWEATRPAGRVRVAAILDEFSYNAFKYECDLLPLDPQRWKEQLDTFQPDLFLCESAWSGADSQTRPWKGRIYSSVNFSGENRTELLKILDYCRSFEIPTVFWNKEDPAHYDDQAHNFVDTALKFDHVFTTDLATVNRYSLEHGHQSVGVLPFAVQPRMFNPMVTGSRSDDVVFAGGWYSNHVRRSEDMAKMFSAVIDSGHNLKIYDRFFGASDPSHVFPEEFVDYTLPAVPNSQISEVYKESIFGMTVNTETNSPTMFARRIFELMACNTYVVSNYSYGVESFFGDRVLFLDKNPDGLKTLSNEDLDRQRAANLQLVLREHTYERRLRTIFERAGIQFQKKKPGNALVVIVSNSDDLPNAWRFLRNVGDWNGPKSILLTEELTPLDYADALTDYNSGGVRVIYLGLLRNGKTSVDQLIGLSEDCLVINFESVGDWVPSTEELDNFRLHSQYIDAPIVQTSDASILGESTGTGQRTNQFSLQDIETDGPRLVSGARVLQHVLQSQAQSTFRAYLI